MNCETCNVEHDGTYGSGRFCNLKCAKSFSSRSKRKEINQKVSERLRGRPSPFKGITGKRATDEDRAKISNGLRKHYQLNPQKVLTPEERRAKNVARVIAYRARKKNALAPDADLKLITRIYKNCPEGYHVDHILALASGGLHHQDNLQYLPAQENHKKGNCGNYNVALAIKWQEILSIYEH